MTTSSKPTTRSFPDDVSLSTELRWRSWPIVDQLPASLGVPAGILATAFGLGYATHSRLAGLVACAALITALATYLLPVTYELSISGFHWRVFGLKRRVAWTSIRAFQPRATGIVLFDRPEPVRLDHLRAHFLPYGDDSDETLCVVRGYLSHAEQLPSG